MPKRLSRLEKRFLRVTRKMFPVGDHTWVLDLCSHLDPPTRAYLGVNEHDEPPLFTRCRQVKFFAKVPLATSGPIVLRAALNNLRPVAEVIDSADLPDGQVYSAYVTLIGWDEIDETCPVPHPCVWVNPHGEFEIAGYVVEPYTSEGRVVAEWLVELGGEFSDLFCVGESSPEVDRELRRVHVGFKRTSKNLRSTGYDLDGSSASTLD